MNRVRRADSSLAALTPFLPALDRLRRPKKASKIVMITAYDVPGAQAAAAGGADWLLVGDSVATVVFGHASTRQADLGLMERCTAAVRRGAPDRPVITDIPYPSSRLKPSALTVHAKRLLRSGADAVKIEWTSRAAAQTARLVKDRIPVMGHVGLTPQDLKPGEAFRVRGADPASASRVLEAARSFEASGAFAVVFECVPESLAKRAAEELSIPVIGIGAGRRCDGQVLVFHDVAGLTRDFGARFYKKYADSMSLQTDAVRRYAREVRSGVFPARRNVYGDRAR